MMVAYHIYKGDLDVVEEDFVKFNSNYFKLVQDFSKLTGDEFISMNTFLTHTVAHSTKPSFMPKTNNQPPKKFLSLALS